MRRDRLVCVHAYPFRCAVVPRTKSGLVRGAFGWQNGGDRTKQQAADRQHESRHREG
jgi:hypothetical protein